MLSEHFSQIWPMASFILLHTALVAYYAGKITGQLTELGRRVQHLDELAEKGGFNHCNLHRQILAQFEKRMDTLEGRIMLLEKIERKIWDDITHE